RDHRVAVNVGRPKVAYRETIGRAVTVSHRFIKQSGGSGQFACVTLAIAPLPRGAGITFTDETKGGVIAREYVPAVEKGMRGAAPEARSSGPTGRGGRLRASCGRCSGEEGDAPVRCDAGPGRLMPEGREQAGRAIGLAGLSPRALSTREESRSDLSDPVGIGDER